MGRRSKARRRGNPEQWQEALTEVKASTAQRPANVQTGASTAQGNIQAVALNGPPAPSTVPEPGSDSEKPTPSILSKKKHRLRRHHKGSGKKEDKSSGLDKGLSNESQNLHLSGADPRGSVVSVDMPAIYPPQAFSGPAAAWPAPTLQQEPFDAYSQLPPSQMQQPWMLQPQTAQLPQDVALQPQSQQLQLPPQLAQPPLMPPFGVPDPALGTATVAGTLQPGPTALPPAPTVAVPAAEAVHVAEARAPGSISDISQASDMYSMAPFAGQPAAILRGSLQDMAMFAAQRPSLQESDARKTENISRFEDTATSPAGIKVGESIIAPQSFTDRKTHVGAADRTKSDRETRLTFSRKVEENVLGDESSVDYSEREEPDEDFDSSVSSHRRSPTASLTGGIQKPRTTKRHKRAGAKKKGKPSSSSEGSPPPVESASILLNQPVPSTAVIINAEMAQRLLAALQKCEVQPPKEAPPRAPEAPQAKPEKSEREKKLAATGAKESAKTAKPKPPQAERLGSSEEFYEEIAEEVVEPDKKVEGSQRKRVIRKTTRSRKHDVTEEPWEDGSPKSSAIPTLPRWENIQPSTSRGTSSQSGRARSSARPARDRNDLKEDGATAPSGATRVRSVSGWPSHADDDRERTTASASKALPRARPNERYPPQRFPYRRYPPPPLYYSSSPPRNFLYDPWVSRQPFQQTTPTQYPNYAGPSWLPSRPAIYNEYYKCYDACAPYFNSNVTQMPLGNVGPAIRQSNVAQLGQRYLPIANETRGGRSQRFQVSEREMTLGRLGDVQPEDFASVRYGHTYQPYNNSRAGQDPQVNGRFPSRQLIGPVRSQASRGPGRQGISPTSDFCIAVRPRPQESYCWRSGTPASNPGVPGTTMCRGSYSAEMATTQPVPIGDPAARLADRSRASALRRPPLSAASSRNGIQRAQSAGPSCARVAPCGCRCHDGRAAPVQGGITLEELLRREDDIRRDEQLRQLSQRLREERIRRDAAFTARLERLDDMQRNADADETAERELERNALYRTYSKDSSACRHCSNAGLQSSRH